MRRLARLVSQYTGLSPVRKHKKGIVCKELKYALKHTNPNLDKTGVCYDLLCLHNVHKRFPQGDIPYPAHVEPVNAVPPCGTVTIVTRMLTQTLNSIACAFSACLNSTRLTVYFLILVTAVFNGRNVK